MFFRDLCEQFLGIMKPNKAKYHAGNRKVLDAPINLGEMAANQENDVDDTRSIWVVTRDDSLVYYYKSKI